MSAESLYSRRSNLIIAFHGCDQSLVNNSMQITSIHTMGTPTGAKELRAVGRAKAGVARLFSVCGIDHRNLLAERDQMFNFTPPIANLL